MHSYYDFYYQIKSFHLNFFFPVNTTDQLRIDLKVPPENFIYLKASTPAERQKWLVALGTAKACIISSNLEEQEQQSIYSKNFPSYFDLLGC